MTEKRTSVFENALIWFGAAVSLAEILTGTYFAPLGFAKGLAAIVLGHIIGCTLLFLSGVIGGQTRLSAMQTVQRSFGEKGALFFAALNILQLVGWTAIMIYDGALAANGVFAVGDWIWSIVIGALIIVWILVGVENLGKLNTVSMVVLALLTVALSAVIFQNNVIAVIPSADGESMSFGAAVELSVAMPLSWLPLISDYTREAEKPVAASAASAAVYGVVSCWMYVIGMGAAIFAQTSDIAQIILKVGFGIGALLIIVLSTVTTTFLDAYSAGISCEVISPKLSGRKMAVLAAVIGTAGAVLFPMDDITDFLYLIGSVFAPMIAVQIADFYILKREPVGGTFDAAGLVIWLVGFVLYRFLMGVDMPVGNTLPDMLATMALCVAVRKLAGAKSKKL